MQMAPLTEASCHQMVNEIQDSEDQESPTNPSAPAQRTMAMGAFEDVSVASNLPSKDETFWKLPPAKTEAPSSKSTKVFSPEPNVQAEAPQGFGGLPFSTSTSGFAPLSDVTENPLAGSEVSPPQPLEEPSSSPIKQTMVFSSEEFDQVEKEFLSQMAEEETNNNPTVDSHPAQTAMMGSDVVERVRSTIDESRQLPTGSADDWEASSVSKSTRGYSSDLSSYLYKEESPESRESSPTIDDIPSLIAEPALPIPYEYTPATPAQLNVKQTMVMEQDNISEWMEAMNVSLEEKEQLEDATDTLLKAEQAADNGDFSNAIDLYMLLIRNFPEESQYQERLQQLWAEMREPPASTLPPSSSSSLEKFIAMGMGVSLAIIFFGFVWPGWLRLHPEPPANSIKKMNLRVMKAAVRPKVQTPQPATMQISSTPAGASVWLNGEETRWKTPATVQRPEGKYVLSLRMEGYKPLEMKLRLQSNQRFSAEFELTKLPSQKGYVPKPRRRRVQRSTPRRRIRLVTQPAGATLFVDGVVQRNTSPTQLFLRPGSYQLQVQKEGYQTYIREIRVTRRSPKNLEVTLTKQASTGTVKIKTRPAGVEVTLNGNLTGKTTPVTLTVPSGTNMLKFTKPGYGAVTRTLRITRGQHRLLSVRLKRSGPYGMVWVPKGSFMMGNNTGLAREKPMRRVQLRGYYIDRYEVTVEAYQRCVAAKVCRPASQKRGCNVRYSSRKKHPINCVNWFEARTYCRWAGKRLPTEAEWEKAARGSTPRTYPWGYSSPSCKRARYNRCRPLQTHTVGSLSGGKSPYGLFDMSGNVWEWVRDKFSANFYRQGENNNPVNLQTGGLYYVIRGGSYKSSSDRIHTTFRSDSWGRQRVPSVGFRCAK